MKNNNNIILLSLFIFTVFITSCTTSGQHLGFSKTEWEHMDSKKRKEFLSHYKELSSSKAKESKNTQESDKDNKNTAEIHVVIMDGKVMMPPFTQAYSYQPVSFAIQEGSCKQVTLQQKTEDTDKHKHSVDMEVCFKNNVLLLDPSRYDANKSDSSARLYRSPLWRRGFSYPHINSTGYARLQDVIIKIYN